MEQWIDSAWRLLFATMLPCLPRQDRASITSDQSRFDYFRPICVHQKQIRWNALYIGVLWEPVFVSENPNPTLITGLKNKWVLNAQFNDSSHRTQETVQDFCWHSLWPTRIYKQFTTAYAGRIVRGHMVGWLYSWVCRYQQNWVTHIEFVD